MLLTVIPVSATYTGGMLSPALAVLAGQNVMIKTGLISGKISFSEDDFYNAVGGEFDAITVTSTPLRSDGVLTYNGSEVSVNQVISASSLSELCFEPTGNSKTGSFSFKSSGEYSTECVLKYTETINLAPTAAKKEEDIAVWTQEDIMTYGTLSGSDPDGDKIFFEITEPAKKGIVCITDTALGNYTYIPCDSMTGRDSFTYTVRDEWGNYSEKSTVVIKIDPPSCDIVFSDMGEHWAHNAALVMASENVMSIKECDGQFLFEPSEKISREDFVVSVMKILGAGDIEPQSTTFADDTEIDTEKSGYIARAQSLGIIKGREKDGLMYFDPKDTVTRAESAVIVNAIIGEKEPETVPTFADDDAVPVYAKGSLYALTSAGIFKGNGYGYISPNEELSRAQVAQILLNIKKIYT